MIKALALFSGGLDSMLAIKIMRSQNIQIMAICFTTPFFNADQAILSANEIEVDLKVEDITPLYMQIIHKPRYGFGKHMNPCIDCHGLMLKKCWEIAIDKGYQFIFTGEVVGQRPMSQRRDAMRAVEKLSGCKGFILRPLSARLLPETIPEQKGWVDREKLLMINGRGRKEQIILSEKFNIKNYPPPAGGCLLTNEAYAKKLKDLLLYNTSPKKIDLELLKAGRHFRFANGLKVIIGRDETDNEKLLEISVKKQDHIMLTIANMPGPIAIIDNKDATESQIITAAQLCASYTKIPRGDKAGVMAGERKKFHVNVTDKAQFKKYML